MSWFTRINTVDDAINKIIKLENEPQMSEGEHQNSKEIRKLKEKWGLKEDDERISQRRKEISDKRLRELEKKESDAQNNYGGGRSRKSRKSKRGLRSTPLRKSRKSKRGLRGAPLRKSRKGKRN